jgi:hypothetical protein
MLTAAEILAADFDFVGADFYEIGGQPLFGQITFYSGRPSIDLIRSR